MLKSFYKFNTPMFIFLVSLLISVEAAGQSLSLNFLSRHDNFRVHGTGFSVSNTLNPNTYHVYLTAGYDAYRGVDSDSDGLFDRFTSIYGMTALRPGGACDYTKDPRDWDPRCSTDAIGYLWKRVPCASSTVACQNNDRWNAWSGTYNVTTFPTLGIWPRTGTAWGTPGYSTVISQNKINNVSLQPADSNCARMGTCPPKTGIAGMCHPYNPDDVATGAANAKVVQVKYADGSTRWFMAFNSMIKYTQSSDGPFSAGDIWRVLWATSPDGANWTIHPNILFRSDKEQQGCFLGFLVTDMFIDNGYFYMLFTDVLESYTYIVRSPIDTVNSPTRSGYTNWSVATLPAGSNQYVWQPLTLGIIQNLSSYAARIFPSRQTSPDAIVKQASIGRVFSSTNPNVSRYVAITVDKAQGSGVIVQLWSTTDLSRPFTYQSDVNMSNISIGANGWEFGFTHYADNLPATPRIVNNGFDLWIVEDFKPGPPFPAINYHLNQITVTRHRAAITGF